MAMSAPMKSVWVFVDGDSSTVNAGIVVTAAREILALNGSGSCESARAAAARNKAADRSSPAARDLLSGRYLRWAFIGVGSPGRSDRQLSKIEHRYPVDGFSGVERRLETDPLHHRIQIRV